MGVGSGLYMYVVVVQKFTFAISSRDEFLSLTASKGFEPLCKNYSVTEYQAHGRFCACVWQAFVCHLASYWVVSLLYFCMLSVYFFCLLHLSVVFYTVLFELRLINTVCQKTSIFLFLFIHLPTSPVYCSHFTLGNPKKSFFNSIIHTNFRLFTLSQKKTNCYPLPTIPEKCHHTTL